jgi:tripartite-type tricarboxylate transporter receptor subunit TctC
MVQPLLRALRYALFVAIILRLGFPVASADAQSVEDFYKGKTVTIVEFSVAGGPYDIYARLLAPFLSKHIPGHPTIVVQLMPGAGGLKAARYLYEAAPKDGTTIGELSQTLIFEPLLGDSTGNVAYQKFGWLGSMSQSTALFVSWKTSQVKKAQDLFAHDLMIAGTGAASETTVVVSTLNGILGTRMKLVQGYAGSPAAMLAMEQGEVDGAFPTSDTLALHPDWLRENKVNLLMQTRQIPDPVFAQVPTAISLAKTDRQRKDLQFLFPRDTIGRPFMTPPGLPADRLKALQGAFAAALQDPDLIAEAKKSHSRIELTRGEDLAKVINEEYSTPADIVADVRAVLPKSE